MKHFIREFTIPTADRGRASSLSPNGGFLVGFGEDAMVVWSTESGEIVKSFEYVSSNASAPGVDSRYHLTERYWPQWIGGAVSLFGICTPASQNMMQTRPIQAE
ncbi:MAG: hypothetical protein R3C56_26340 [Pirellulaceae bacterium]